MTHHKRFAYRLHMTRSDKLREEQHMAEERLLREVMQQRCYRVRKFAAGTSPPSSSRAHAASIARRTL
jgi:hypothetical protein